MNFTFTEQMEENTQCNLRFPFHIHKDKLSKQQPSIFPEKQCVSTFERLLRKAYNEPFAVYLTEEDREWYSKQELTLFDKVVAREQQKINDGWCKIDLELSDDTIDALIIYKTKTNITFEEAIITLLSEMLEENEKEYAHGKSKE